jgi:hypothetical protein
MVVSGEASIGNEKAKNRDAVGIWDTPSFSITADTDTELLIIDVPMN